MSPQYLLGERNKLQNPDGSYNLDWAHDENWGPRFDPNVKVASALYWDPRTVGIGEGYAGIMVGSTV